MRPIAASSSGRRAAPMGVGIDKHQRPSVAAASAAASNCPLAPLAPPAPSRAARAAAAPAARRRPHPQQQQQQRPQRPPATTTASALPETAAAATATATTLIATTWSSLPPTYHDALCLALAAAGGYAWVKAFDRLAASGALDRALSRKLVHATAGPLLVLTWPMFSADPHARFAAAAVPALNAARLLLVGSGALRDRGLVASVSRGGGKGELLKGPLYYVIVLSALTATFWRDFPLPALVAVSAMCGGDGLADIVGRRLGKGNPLPWNGQKSFAGSAAMAGGGVAAALGMAAVFQAAGWDVSGGAIGGGLVGADATTSSVLSLFPRLLAISLACTAAESLPAGRGFFPDDNLSVPLVAVAGSLLLFPPPAGGGVGLAALALAAGGAALAVGAANAVAAGAGDADEEEEKKGGEGAAAGAGAVKAAAGEEGGSKLESQQHHFQQQAHSGSSSTNGSGLPSSAASPSSLSPSSSPPPPRKPTVI